MAGAQFPIQPALTAIAVGYRNTDYIADLVAPRVTVAAEEFEWLRWNLADGFTIPDTRVGRKGQPAEVEFTATEETSSTFDYGLDSFIPQKDIDNAPPNYDPEARATEGTTDLVLLDREKRVADTTFALATYASTMRTTLSGTSQWSDFTNSNPLTAIKAARDSMIMPGNVLVLGQQVWSTVQNHPVLVRAVFGPLAQGGQITRQQLAAALEIDEVVVGNAWANTARAGQTVSLGRVWGKHAALIRRERNPAGPNRMPTFMWTAQFGTRIAGRIPEPKRGLRGGITVRVGESVREVVSAPELGYLWRDAIA